MTQSTGGLELSIDTASAMASIALSRDGVLVAEMTWDCGRDHAREVLPAIDRLLQGRQVPKDALTAIFVDIGPGSYAGIRTGVSTAKALAHGLGTSLAGVGRLEIEAYALAGGGQTITSVHEAGRAQVAWASYSAAPAWREVSPPVLTARQAIGSALAGQALITGDVSDELAAMLSERGHRVVRGAAAVRRAAFLAELGHKKLRSGRQDDPRTLVPLYLRDPAIGPQS
jgi:tRNA threonylcarbamoyladenosine biosynthesis protein TsaB